MVHRKQESRQETAAEYVKEHGLNSSNVTKEHLETLYFSMKLPLNIIAKQFQRSPRTISKWLKKYGLDTRSIGAARSVHLKQNFFKNWTPSMAWVLGLCFTDGYFKKNQIRLMLKDQETLEKIKSLVGPYLTIYKRPQPYDKSNLIYSLTFGNQEMASDLVSLGITSRKSLTMQFPVVPPLYIKDFIRGCWDGDGGFSFTNGKLSAHYTCGSLEFIERIREELFQIGINRRILRGISARNSTSAERRNLAKQLMELRKRYGGGPYPLRIYERKNAKAYDIRFTGDEHMLIFYKYLYGGDLSMICMSRKQLMLREYLSRRDILA